MAVTWKHYLYVFGGEWTSEDKRRFKQYGDLWRYDSDRSCWEEIKGKGPGARSGARGCVVGEELLLYGGFTEGKKGTKYLMDLTPFDFEEGRWGKARKGNGPGPRAGGCFWSSGGSALYFAGNRTRARKGGELLEVLGDVWRVSGGSWSSVPTTGGPPARSGWSHAEGGAGTRLFFGGVQDVARKGDQQTSAFFNDVWHFDEATGTFSTLWSPIPRSAELDWGRAELGGVDVLALLPKKAAKTGAVPRGRMATACTVHDGALWVFGGSCEAGPRQEVTLDDLWRFDLTAKVWTCALELSERTAEWFDEDSEDEAAGLELAMLPKKEQHRLAKLARMDGRRTRLEEKAENRREKKDQKLAKQVARTRANEQARARKFKQED